MPTPQRSTAGTRGNASPKTTTAKPATKKTSSATTAAKPARTASASGAKSKATGAGVAKTSRSQSPKTSTTTARKTTTAKPQTKPHAKAQAGSRAGAAGGQTGSRAGGGTTSRASGKTGSQAKSKASSKSKTSSSKAGASQNSGTMHDASATIASYVSSMKSNLKDWGIEIDTLKAKADKAGAGMRTEINRQIEMLYEKQKEASTRLQHLMEATGPAWRDLSRGIERAVRDLRTSLEKSSKTSK